MAPRVDIDLAKIADNARALVSLAADSGISITGVTKAALGMPELGRALLGAGARRLGDSRIENIERLRDAGIDAPIVLLRSPMMSQVERVVRSADISCNTEPTVLTALSAASRSVGVSHGVLLMVELGDLREGIRPSDLCAVVETTLALPGITLDGIGTNLACRSGIAPDQEKMDELSQLADRVESTFGITLDLVSGGNSANLPWLMTSPDTGRVNDLRLGESILLGLEPLHRTPLTGLHQDAITITAEVIESKRKPSVPWGVAAQGAFGVQLPAVDRGEIWQTIVALGHQDTDPGGLSPPDGVRILGASSDHLVLETPDHVVPGDVIVFRPDYGAFVRAMTSPFLAHDVPGAGFEPARSQRSRGV